MTVQAISRNQILVLTLFFLPLASSCGPVNPINAPTATSPASTPGPDPESTPLELIQAGTPYSENIRFERIGLEEGLSQSVVHVILQDSKGFLWVGTEDGLNRFDGYRFKVYRPDTDNPSSLSDRWVTSLAEDPHGYLWVGTRTGGVNRYDPNSGKFTRFNYNDSNGANSGPHQINALFADEQGLWTGTETGLISLISQRSLLSNSKPLRRILIIRVITPLPQSTKTRATFCGSARQTVASTVTTDSQMHSGLLDMIKMILTA
jgi:hypothetical protein